MSDGTVKGAFGSPGKGKSWHIMNRLIPAELELGAFAVYSTPKQSDADAWKLGPVIRNPREVYGKDLGDTRAILILKNHDGARELVAQVRKVFPRVVVAYDEAHELWHASLDATPEKLRSFHTIRDERNLVTIWASQWPAKFSKVVYRATVDLGGVDWFGLTTPKDVFWVEDEYGAAAALQVSELPPRQFIHVQGSELPPGWDEFRERLRRKSARLAR